MPLTSHIISNGTPSTGRFIQFTYSRTHKLYSVDDLNLEITALQADLVRKGVEGEFHVTVKTVEELYPFSTPIVIGRRPIHLQKLQDHMSPDEQQFMIDTGLKVFTNCYVIIHETNYFAKIFEKMHENQQASWQTDSHIRSTLMPMTNIESNCFITQNPFGT